jgi:hypothetical protein
MRYYKQKQTWMKVVRRLELQEGVDPVVAAAVTAFGFVFIHPFDDGNGRIHRFLVHHILARLGSTPPGILFPVSAAMLRDRRAYDEVLERFSDSILPFIRYDLDLDHGMVVHNDTARLYCHFDATAQAEYLYRWIEETIRRDLRDEIGFLAVFDTALRAVLNIVDMPNRRPSLLVTFILQNKGRLPRANELPFRKSPTRRSIELKKPSGEHGKMPTLPRFKRPLISAILCGPTGGTEARYVLDRLPREICLIAA